MPWGAPLPALPVGKGRDCPALLCAGVASPRALHAGLGIAVQERHKTIQEQHGAMSKEGQVGVRERLCTRG